MFIDYKKTPIYYQTFGKGPVITLLHGFLESSTMWNSAITMLSQNNTIISIDLPGHGKSGVISENHSMELMAEVIHYVLQHLEIKTTSIVGHSMGGYVALAYTELYPEEVEKLILINSTPEADSEERKNNRNRAINLLTTHPKAYINMAIGNLIASDSKEKFSEEINNLIIEAHDFPVEGLKSALRGMRDRKNRTQTLKNFKNIKHMLLSIDDPILPIKETKQAAKNSQTPMKVIEGGHLSLIENIEAVNLFLSRLTILVGF